MIILCRRSNGGWTARCFCIPDIPENTEMLLTMYGRRASLRTVADDMSRSFPEAPIYHRVDGVDYRITA
jgi:hypothetical protein